MLDGGGHDRAADAPPPVAPPSPAWTSGPPASPAPTADRRARDPGRVPGLRPVGPTARTAGALPSSEVRKVVTIIFTDLKGSTALAESVDSEAVNEVKERYFSTVTEQIERYGGRVEKYIGDAIMAVFGLPRAREDDALRAVRAAFGMVGALERLNERPGSRVRRPDRQPHRRQHRRGRREHRPDAQQRLATGDAVNVAARLEQAAPVNEVLIGDVTYASSGARSSSRRSSRSS